MKHSNNESDDTLIFLLIIIFTAYLFLSGCSCKAGNDFISELSCTQEDK